QDPARVQAVVVTLLEEMPVQETVEAVGALSAAGIAVGPIVANQVVRPRLDAAAAEALVQLGPDGLRDRAERAGATMSGRTAELALQLADEHLARLGMQHRLRVEVEERTGHGVLAAPFLTD